MEVGDSVDGWLGIVCTWMILAAMRFRTRFDILSLFLACRLFEVWYTICEDSIVLITCSHSNNPALALAARIWKYFVLLELEIDSKNPTVPCI